MISVKDDDEGRQQTLPGTGNKKTPLQTIAMILNGSCDWPNANSMTPYLHFCSIPGSTFCESLWAP